MHNKYADLFAAAGRVIGNYTGWWPASLFAPALREEAIRVIATNSADFIEEATPQLILDLRDDLDRLCDEAFNMREEIARLRSILRDVAIDAYGSGRVSGHEDTVDSSFVPYSYNERADVFGVVADEIIAEHLQRANEKAVV